MDDSGNGYGADVLFALNCNGYSDYIRLIHEKENSIEESTKQVEILIQRLQ